MREATEGEVAMLVGRPVNGIKRADEEGNPCQLSEQGRTQPPAVEMTPAAMTPTGRRTKLKAGPTVRLAEKMTYARREHNGQMR